MIEETNDTETKQEPDNCPECRRGLRLREDALALVGMAAAVILLAGIGVFCWQIVSAGPGAAEEAGEAPVRSLADLLSRSTGAQIAVGVMIAALVSLLVVLWRVRTHFRVVGPIRRALLAMGNGETAAGTLAVSSRLGAEAQAWNRLLNENEKLRKQILIEEARQTLESHDGASAELARVCEAMSQGVLLLDEKQRVKYANAAGAVFLHAKQEELTGTEIVKLLPEQDGFEAIRTALTGSGCQRLTVDVDQRAAGGGVSRFHIRPLHLEDSSATMVTIEDVTQQRVAAEARNAFLAQAAHELRTPLMNIVLYAENAMEEGEDNPALRAKSLNVINQEARRLEGMVQGMLSVSEIEAGTMDMRRDDVRLETLFEQLEDDYMAQATEKRIALTFNLPPKLPVIQGDRDKIVMVLQNLLGNALKYTPAEGKVSVDVAVEPDQLVVGVADTGIGINEEDRERIFERFCRADDPRVADVTGSGLGLSLAREVIRLHGGDIMVQSEIDKGSTFTLTLPTHEEAA